MGRESGVKKELTSKDAGVGAKLKQQQQQPVDMDVVDPRNGRDEDDGGHSTEEEDFADDEEPNEVGVEEEEAEPPPEPPPPVDIRVTAFVDDEGAGDTVDRDLEHFASARRVAATDLAMKDYVVVDGLGKGGFSAVMLVRRTSDRKLFALKTIKKHMIREAKHRKRLQVERVILAELPPNPFIARLTKSFQTETELFFLMDYCAGGDLCYQCYKMFTKIDYFNDGQARFYISQIILAIEHLHSHGFVHRDIKPEK